MSVTLLPAAGPDGLLEFYVDHQHLLGGAESWQRERVAAAREFQIRRAPKAPSYCEHLTSCLAARLSPALSFATHGDQTSAFAGTPEEARHRKGLVVQSVSATYRYLPPTMLGAAHFDRSTSSSH